jgi:hypothetical protein
LSKTNSIIEVNGNRYDAISGQLVQAARKPKTSPHTSSKTMIDGFVLGSHHAKRQVKKSLAHAKSRTKVASMDIHGRQQRSRTLMRQVVKKPAGKSPSQAEQPLKANNHHVSPLKQLRAKTAVKHPHVNRFGYFAEKPQAKPSLEPARPAQKPAAEIMPASPALPSLITSASHHKLEKMLDEALLNADAHKQIMNRRSQPGFLASLTDMPRWMKFAALAVFVSVAALFLIWQNLPAVAVHVAAAKAHVNAALPSYTPEGFAYAGSLKYAPGAVTMEFKDKKHDQGSFSLTQTASNLSGQSLQDSALPKDSPVQTSEVKGTTVYIYGNSNALWTNRHVLYKLENKANLSSDQVLKIVQSL